MVRGWPGAVILVGLGALGCGKPSFTYDIPPGASFATRSTIALDPRTDYVYVLEGKRQVRDPEVQAKVLSMLEAKGYRVVPAPEADLWVDAFLALGAAPSRPEAPPAPRGHGSHGGMHGRHSGDAASSASHGEGGSHHGGGGMGVLVELVARPSLDRVWFGMGEVAPSEGESHHGGDSPLEGTLRKLLEPLPARALPKPSPEA